MLELYTSDQYVAKLLQLLATQDDLGSDIEPAWVESKLRCRRREAFQTLKALGNTKVAKFILGRKGARTRLEWGFGFGEKIATEVINEVNAQLNVLATEADTDDQEAQTKLGEMALLAGINEWRIEEAEDWTAVAKMIAPGTRGETKAPDSEELPSDTPTELTSVPHDSDGPESFAKPNFVDTKILLRPDLWVVLSLPKDLTQDEAERLGGVVRNLWLVSSKGQEPQTPASLFG